MKQLHYKEAALIGDIDILRELGARIDGLTPGEIESRRLQFGYNRLEKKASSWVKIFVRQFKSAFIYLLFGASVISYLLGDSKIDSLLIFIFLLANAFLGFFQEYRAEHALTLLKDYVTRTARVRRGGKEVRVPIEELVPGDIVLLDAGDMIPADGRFIKGDRVTVDESPMTGETEPVEKNVLTISSPVHDFYDAKNIGFSRTTLLSGDAELVVFATGAQTEVGSIVSVMEQADRSSAFEEGINKFSTFILKLVFATIPMVFLLNVFVHHDGINFTEFLLFSIALTVSVIPEALPLVTTLSLSRGALVLAKKQVVPRRLTAIEDLGSIDILCTDKTGTITQNMLSVGAIYGEVEQVLRFALMSPLSHHGANGVQNTVFDDAIKEKAGEARMSALGSVTRVNELPFDPVRKKESVLVDVLGKRYLVTRGAPEEVYGKRGYGKDVRAWIETEGDKGCRVLAVAYKEIADGGKVAITPKDESGLTVLGMISFLDPLKPSTKGAVSQARKLGITVKIITGDSKEVAGWVGKEAGIVADMSQVITGDELAQLSLEDKLIAVEKYHVFARTMPLQKYEIIELLQKKHLVGFLGEGFNDAPALKIAHVGLAVQNASDIAQDASDVVLLNQSLEVIIDGVKEGRVIFANSMKYLRTTLSSNFGNFYALALSSLFIPYLPMLPIQVLLLNLLSDFPMMSISSDTVDDDELKSPRGYEVSELLAVAVVLGVTSMFFDFAFFGYFAQFNDEKILQTMWFMGSILTELFVLFSIRTTLPMWKAKRPSALVIWLTGIMATITVVLPFIPLAQEWFNFMRPTAPLLFAGLILVILDVVFTEAVKLMFYRYWGGKKVHQKTA